MAAFLLSASSNASCWHYTSCTVDPPPCCCLPNRIISCVTAVATDMLALQIWERHHFKASKTSSNWTHLPDNSGSVCEALSNTFLGLTFCYPDGLFSLLGSDPLNFISLEWEKKLYSGPNVGTVCSSVPGTSPAGLLRWTWPKKIIGSCNSHQRTEIFWWEEGENAEMIC